MELHEYQRILLDILVEFDSFCQKRGLRYSLFGGTLLGAIRHDGFIPWDDDLDVIMPREDYDIFIDEFLPSESHYALLKPSDKNYYYPYSKLCNITVPVVERHRRGKMYAFIDIFPADRFIDNKKNKSIANKYRSKIMYYGQSVPTIYRTNSFPKSFLLCIFICVKWLFSKLIVFRKVLNKFENFIKKNSDQNSDIYMHVTWSNNYSLKFNFNNLRKHVFENFSFTIFDDFNDVLTLQYGNYLCPPENPKLNHGLYLIDTKTNKREKLKSDIYK